MDEKRNIAESHYFTVVLFFILTLTVTIIGIFFSIKVIRGAEIINWTQTDWQSGVDSGVIATSASNQTGWTQYSSVTNLSATSSPGDLKLATTSSIATDDGTFSATGLATGGGLSNGTVVSTTVSESGAAASVRLAVNATTSVNIFDSTMPPVPGTVSTGSGMIRNGDDDEIYVIQPGTGFHKYSVSGNSWTTLAVVPGTVGAGSEMIRNGSDNDIYLLQGGGTGIYKYSISDNSWTTLTVVPGTIGNGGTMIRNGSSDDIYVLQGGNATGFYRYSIASDTWSALTVVPATVNTGGTMIRNGSDNDIYVLEGTGSSAFFRYSISDNSWTTLTAAPAVAGNGATMIRNGSDDNFYFIPSSSGGSTAFYSYSIASNTWSTLTVVPAFLSGPASMFRSGSDDYIYLFQGAVTSAFFRYSISGNSWTTLTALPGNTTVSGVMVRNGLDDQIYVLAAAATNGFFKYSVSGNSWEGSGVSSIPAVPGAVGTGSAMIRNGADDDVYVLQGGSATGFYHFSIASNTWNTLTVVPASVSTGASMIRNGSDDNIYVLTGNGTGFYSYSISDDSWTTLTVVPASVSTGASMIRNGSDDNIYVLTGNGTGFYSYSISGNSWATLTVVPASVSTGASMIRNGSDNNIYVLRGASTGFYSYSISDNSWTTLTVVPASIGSGSSMIRNGSDDSIYVLRGGSTGFYSYSISGNSWTTLTVVPSTVGAGGSMIRNGSDDDIYILRGNTSNAFYRYSISGNAWTTLVTVPVSVAAGCIMMRNGADHELYILQGNSTSSLWRYLINTTTYSTSGTFTSAVIDTAGAATFGNISWTSALPVSTTLTFATRSGATASPDGTWSDWSTELSNSAGSAIVSPVARYIQYRGTFGTSNTAKTPTLSNFSLAYSAYQLTGNLVSSVFNTGEVDNIMGGISWTEDVSLPTSTTVTVSLRTAASADSLIGSWVDFTNTITNCTKSSSTVSCTIDALPTAFKSGDDDQYFQYKITLTSPDGVASPSVGGVVLSYTQLDAASASAGVAFPVNQLVILIPTASTSSGSATSTQEQIRSKIIEDEALILKMEEAGQKVPIALNLSARDYKGLFTKVFAFGSKNIEVKTLQQFLNVAGFIVAKMGPGSPGNETIFFGKLTEAALAKFQVFNGITIAQGKLDLETRIFIENLSGTMLPQLSNDRVLSPIFTRDLKLKMTGEDVRYLQMFLNSKGFIVAPYGPGSPGNETIFFGKLTEAALAKFKVKNDLQPSSGYLDSNTRSFIKSLR